MKILVTDIYFRKSFDCINILKLHFALEDFIFTDSNVSFFRKNKAKIIYGSSSIHLLRMDENFESDLVEIANKYDEDILYIPIEEGTTFRFTEFLHNTKTDKFKCLLPSLENFITSRNKESLNLFCQKKLIACPKYISEETLNNKDFYYPIICKPKHGSGAKGITYIENDEDLKELTIDFDKYFVQERLPNPKEVEAGFFLCEKGEIKSFYSHKRIRTYPEKGGVTVFSQSKDSQKIKEIGTSILKQLDWSGLLMIEFIFDERDRKYKLIEINPRLWGSIMLSEFCDANFLKSYVDLAMGKNIEIPKINTNVYIRWIFPYDIMYWIKNLSNPFLFFKPMKNTCYINFTYTSYLRSFSFILITYFNPKKIVNLFVK